MLNQNITEKSTLLKESEDLKKHLKNLKTPETRLINFVVIDIIRFLNYDRPNVKMFDFSATTTIVKLYDFFHLHGFSNECLLNWQSKRQFIGSVKPDFIKKLGK